MKFMTQRKSPFFQAGNHWWVDLLFGHGFPIDAEPTTIAHFIATAPGGTILLARRLTRAEVAAVEQQRFDADSERHSFIIPTERARWRKPRRR